MLKKRGNAYIRSMVERDENARGEDATKCGREIKTSRETNTKGSKTGRAKP